MSEMQNPPAFPQQCADALDVGMVHEGMTLRDWFAGQAIGATITAITAGKVPLQNWIGTPSESAAAIAYAMADAMLAARTRELAAGESR